MKEYVRNILKIFLMRRVLMMQCFQQLVELEYLADWAIGEYGKPFCNKSGLVDLIDLCGPFYMLI
ncbi:hypothetical protein HanPSC8_Chr11g0455791 [Helianthus annuus]|nr:hypothetical protein HanPSC8_Chr11g0455791 [Helianthus annuus]